MAEAEWQLQGASGLLCLLGCRFDIFPEFQKKKIDLPFDSQLDFMEFIQHLAPVLNTSTPRCGQQSYFQHDLQQQVT